VTEVTDAPQDGHDRTEPVDIQYEMQRSYIDYAMSVIIGRALPDVRDGLKPVHTRILYAMYDSGFRPDRGFFKCSRVVGDVMGNYHPHGDSAIYDALVRMAQPWSMRMPLIDSQGNFGSPGNDPPAAMRYTECRLAPLAMEMLRDINEDTVDFRENYDGRSSEPVVLPSRFPNLLINGSEGIAVGMATKIPPHNLREVAAGVAWYLEHFEASDEELLDALMERVKGPDFPTRGLIVGRRGIRDAYRTGRGSIIMRAVVEVEEDARGRTCLVVKELPYQVNPDNLAQKIAELVRDGRIGGIANIQDETSGRTAASSSARGSSATSWATTTRTATVRSTTRWSGWRSPGRCGCRWSTGRATSAPRATTRPRPCGTPSAAWPRWRWRCCGTSTRTRSTSARTTTGARPSPWCCRAGSPTC